jgi:hypothetical protein
MTGIGPGWPALPDPLPPTPYWINGRALPAVWRELLGFAQRGLVAAAKQFPHMLPGQPWQHRPDPGSDSDIDQAIAAKLYLALHALPLLAEAEVALIAPPLADLIPDWDDGDAATQYAAAAQLPYSPLFLDFEGVDGLPAAWEADTWPLPLHLRGALCWEADGMLCVIPFGSVGGVHPWGGLDYHPWARWIVLQQEREEWPLPGPGDFLARANGEVLPWVEVEGESVCAHQGALAWNLSRRALQVVQLLEHVGGGLVESRLPRPARRRAAREGKRIAHVPARFPTFEGRRLIAPPAISRRAVVPCVVPKTHARLEQAHLLWHEALAAYHDPDLFVVKLNALLEAMRTVTFVLKKEFRNSDEFKSWYSPWERGMRADARLKWARDARNEVEKEGDLETSSVAHVRVLAGGWAAEVTEYEVDPSIDASEILRGLHLGALPAHVVTDGLLEVERRWRTPDLPGEEVLEVLAHCWGALARVVAAGHQARGQNMETCGLTAESACGAEVLPAHPTGRWRCMVASREARTRRRNLATGAPHEIEIVARQAPRDFDEDAARDHYGLQEWEPSPADADLTTKAASLHRFARNVLVADRYHLTIAWLLREGANVDQSVLLPEDQQDKTMMAHRLAVEADRLGADGLILTTEAWLAPLVERDDPRFALRAQDRDDRAEALITYAVARDGPCHTWISAFSRNADDSVVLDEVQHQTAEAQPLFEPLLTMWATWPPDAGAPAERP